MKIRMVVVLFCFVFNLQAQETYSFITDKRFKSPSDLAGYNFIPNYMEIPDESSRDLEPGEYSFGVTRNNLYVRGEGIEGVYSLNNINTTEYGYQLLLMNARDSRIQGHLKVILNKYAQVDALVFKRSGKDKEIIFYNSEIPEKLSEKEQAYFTDIWELELEHPDSLWGFKLFPFFRIHQSQGVQERLQIADSTSISFYETTTIVDKTKEKNNRKKKNKAKEAKEESEFEEDSADLTVNEKKLKIIKEHFVEIRSILTYEDGEQEDKKWVYKVKSIKEREDAQAGPNDEKYQIEIETSKGGSLYLYLLPKRTISSFEMEGFKYLMQGH